MARRIKTAEYRAQERERVRKFRREHPERWKAIDDKHKRTYRSTQLAQQRSQRERNAWMAVGQRIKDHEGIGDISESGLSIISEYHFKRGGFVFVHNGRCRTETLYDPLPTW